MNQYTHPAVTVVLVFVTELVSTLNSWAHSYMPLLYSIAIIVSIISTLKSMRSNKGKKQ